LELTNDETKAELEEGHTLYQITPEMAEEMYERLKPQPRLFFDKSEKPDDVHRRNINSMWQWVADHVECDWKTIKPVPNMKPNVWFQAVSLTKKEYEKPCANQLSFKEGES